MKDLARMDPDGVVMGNFDDDEQAKQQDQRGLDDYDEQQMAEDEEQYRMMVEADLAEHGIQSFFEVPYDYQEVIFMMVKGDNDGLAASKLYNEQADLFNYYLELVIRFNQDFDPTETLMAIAKDGERIEAILNAPDALVPLSYILEDLWPRIGFLPIDPENPGLVLIAEFMLNELILKYSESLDKLNLVHLKELFSGDDDGEYEDDADEMQQYADDADHQEAMLAEQRQMGQLKRQNEQAVHFINQQDDGPDSPNERYYAQQEEEFPPVMGQQPPKKVVERPKDNERAERPKSRKPDIKQMAPPSKGSDDEKKSEDVENYSSPEGSNSSSDGNDVRFLDINDLKKQREVDVSDKRKKGDDGDNYDDDDFI